MAWKYDNGDLFRNGKLVAELLSVMGEPFGRTYKNPVRQQAARDQVDVIGAWLAEVANQAEKQGNNPLKK